MADEFYKYLDKEGVKATLRDGTLMFSRPSVFNDPFDMLIDGIFSFDPTEDTESFIRAFCSFVRQENFPDVSSLSPMGENIRHLFNLLKKGNLDTESFERELLKDPEQLFDIEKQRERNRLYVKQINEIFESTGVLCGSKRPDNLLLWAHYAEQHFGGVIKLKPQIDKDSLLLAAKEVNYTCKRPFLYESHEDFIKKSIVSENERAEELSDLITLSKGLDWAYEEELRVSVHDLMDEENRKTLRYFDEEVDEVFIGCRASSSDVDEIVELATKRNPNVKINKMKTSSTSFSLETENII